MANAVAHPKADIPEGSTQAGHREVTWVMWRIDDSSRASPESIWKGLNSYASGICRSYWLENVNLPSLKCGRKGLNWARVDIGAFDGTWILPDEVEAVEYGGQAFPATGL